MSFLLKQFPRLELSEQLKTKSFNSWRLRHCLPTALQACLIAGLPVCHPLGGLLHPKVGTWAALKLSKKEWQTFIPLRFKTFPSYLIPRDSHPTSDLGKHIEKLEKVGEKVGKNFGLQS